MHAFLLHFCAFFQFLVLDCVLVHYGSEPFKCVPLENLAVNCLSYCLEVLL